jgi:predicted O-methyltransferase YrrM
MTNRTVPLTDDLYQYFLSISLREPPLLERLRKETAGEPDHNMQIAPEQGQFMSLLVQMLGATRALEIGVYTGYSSLWVALALPPGGKLIACDVSKEWTRVARRYWKEAGVADKVELRLGPALDTLDTLLAKEGAAGTFDFVFIDADKENSGNYYERSLELLRPGGLIAVDNAFRSGRVVDPKDDSPETQAIRDFNEKLRKDRRIVLSVVPIADGLTLALKKG